MKSSLWLGADGREAREDQGLKPLILVAGGTGYVGGELLQALLAAGQPVRCLARRPEVLEAKGLSGLEVVGGDVLDSRSVHGALVGVHTAYYLVHSMGSAQSFEEQDRAAAQNFADAAREGGVRRIIYLGGLGHGADMLSAHLRSRHEVGEILRSTGVPVVEFRASVVIGSGSLSFEMIRALVERLPVMIAPRWVSVAAQPIATADLIAYLLAALNLPLDVNKIYEIGGSDRVSYGGLMKEYARQRGLNRLVISLPFLTPRLSSLWLGLVTPLYVRVGRKLIDSICHATIVEDQTALALFGIRPCGFREAIAAALSADGGHLLIDSRTIHVAASPEDAFAPIRRIGGARGWYYANWLWQLRGLLDRLFGGVGLRRGRRDPDSLRVGDTVGFWRVEAIEPDHRLRLAAEAKLPGHAWLEFEVTKDSTGSVIRQTATFDPKGLLGRAYWYSVFPLHQFVFGGMLQGIAARGRIGH
ncbi:MAG TPA: SDR family oxidoreductase [Gemmatimonadaceae bacterium]|nr:SDR family oxidoreductase [Gemmatimonadaceae bacterium]